MYRPATAASSRTARNPPPLSAGKYRTTDRHTWGDTAKWLLDRHVWSVATWPGLSCGTARAPDFPRIPNLASSYDRKRIELCYGQTGVVCEDSELRAHGSRYAENPVFLAHREHFRVGIQLIRIEFCEDPAEVTGLIGRAEILGERQCTGVGDAPASRRV